MDKFEKPHRIEDLEKKLYSPNQNLTQKERKHLNTKEYDVAQNWPTTHVDIQESDLIDEGKKPNWFFRFFLVALVFFIGAAGYLGFTWYLNSGVRASNVDILINAPLSIGAGENFDFEVVMQNKNQMPIKYVDIEILFPDGTRSVADISKEFERTTDRVEVIQIGEVVKKNYNALLFGEENEKKDISVLLTYQIDESTQLFKKEKKFDVVLSSTPIRLTITNVKEITSGQDLAFTLELVSNSTQTLKNVMVQAVYPFGFTYQSSTLPPKDDKKTWVIPSLAPKETLTFTLRGNIDGQNKDDKFFKFLVGLEDEKTGTPQVVFTTKDALVSLARPFLELNFAVDEQNSNVIILDSGISSNATISFRNNTEFQLRNASISLVFDGSALAKDSVTVGDGFYQSLTNTIVWDNTTSDKLITIPVGSTGQVSFNFNGMGEYLDKIIVNPEVNLKIGVKANRNLENGVSELIENTITKKIRFNTQVSLKSENMHYSSVFTNSGPIPPQVEQKTTYTGILTLQNTSNALANGVVTMRIPNYVRYEGVFSPETENVSYDSSSRILSWNVGTVSAKTGYMEMPPKQLQVQVSIIPSISQAGTTPDLVENIRFTGTDTFTKKEITQTAKPITTEIRDAKDFYSSQVTK